MKLVRIEDGEHVVRFCKRKHAIRDGGTVVGVYPDFFHLRPEVPPDNAPEKFLSAVFYEFFDGSPIEVMEQCREAIGRVLHSGEALVRLGAAEIRAEGAAASVALKVMHEASHKTVPSKARIEGLPMPPHVELASALAAKAVKQIVGG